jgi:hypothetical protein
MKHFLFIIFTLVIIPLNAQTSGIDFRERLNFGLKVGANYSNVFDSKGDEFHANAKLGFAGGAFLAIPIGKYLGVQPEILISQKGFQGTGRLLGSLYDFSRTTTYIDIPLFVALKPASFFTIMAGPQYSYLMKQKDVFRSGYTSIEQEKEFINENLRKNMLGFVLGVEILADHFVFGLRFGADTQTNNGNGTSSTPRYKNVWYQGAVGYRF